METRTIKWLNKDEMKILKQIYLVDDRLNGEETLGNIYYTRPFTDDYNLIKQQEEDEKATSKIDKFFSEYPKQKNYPEDDLDRSIVGAVRTIYPKSFVRNDTILFNVDLEKLDILKRKVAVKSHFNYIPHFSIANFESYQNQTYNSLKLDCTIYTYKQKELLAGIQFYANYNATDETIIDKLRSVCFE